jgi:hypothetical protein
MAIYSQDFYRGILLRDPRFSAENISSTDTTATQASPTVDEPSAQAGKEGTMDLQATGTSLAGAGYDIRAIKPGAAWGEDRGGRFSWRPTSESADATKWRGWNPYSLITGSEYFKHLLGAGKSQVACWPDAITTAAEWVHVVYSIIGTVGTNQLMCRTRNPDTDLWSEVEVDTLALGATVTAPGPSAILELPGGRLLIIRQHWSSTGTVETFFSDDRGVTWEQGSHKRTAPGIEAVDMTFGASISAVIKVRAVYHNGYITMIREARTDSTPDPYREVDHYVSEDLGASWTLIERFQPDLSPLVGKGTSAARVHDPELAVDETGAVVMVFSREYDPNDISSGGGWSAQTAWAKKATPLGRFADDPNFSPDASPGTLLGRPPGRGSLGSDDNVGHHVVCTDPDGMLCVVAQGPVDVDGSGNGTTMRAHPWVTRHRFAALDSTLTDTRTHSHGFFGMSDVGVTTYTGPTEWPLLSIVGVTGGSAPTFAYRLSRSCVTPYKGKLLLISGMPYDIAGGQSDADDMSLRLIELGGSDNYDHEQGHVWSLTAGTPARLGYTYLPFETPPNLVSNVTSLTAFSVVGSMAFTFGSQGLTMTSTSDAYGVRHPGRGTWARCKSDTVVSTSGGDINGAYISVRADGVEVRIGRDSAQVWDLTGVAASLTSIITLPEGMRDWFVTTELRNTFNYAWVMYKDPGSSAWTTVTFTGTGQLSGALTGDSEWGQPQTSSVVSHWEMVQTFKAFSASGADWSTTGYHPDKQNGRPFSVYETYMDAGWQLAARGGSAFKSDEWQALTRYEFPIDAIHPEIAGTPRVGWRSVNDDAEQIITWTPAGTTDTRQLSPVIGVHLSGINFRTAYLEGWDGAAWANVCSIDAGADFSGLQFNRSGDTIYPNASGSYAAKRYVQFEELRDGYAVFDPGGGSEAVRRIVHNSEGGWANPAPPKPAELHIDGDASTLPASGNFEVWEGAVTTVGYGSTTAYDKYRLRIPVQQTAEGYFKIGACVIGPVLYFGTDYSWGRSMELSPNQEIITGRSGDRLVEELGPARRLVEFAWTEGWDTTKISGDSPSGYDHITADGADRVGVRQDATVLEGMLRRARGAAEPVVYLPRIVPDDTNSPGQDRQILGRDRHMYGRVTGQVTRQAILGDESTDEVHTINAITIEEEV